MEGTNSFQHGWESSSAGNLTLTKILTMGTSFTFQYRYAYDISCSDCLSKYFIVNLYHTSANTLLQSTQISIGTPGTIVYDSGVLNRTVDTSNYANSTVKVQFVWVVPQASTGPAFFEFDNIQFAGCGK